MLDANNDIQAEKHTFSNAFNRLYGDIIEYHTNISIDAVDSDNKVVYTNIGEFQADVLNIIPKQKASAFLVQTGLTDLGDWAPIDLTTYESTLYGFENVHIIGDAQATKQPKSAHMANSQAKICADAVLRSLFNLPTDDDERLDNITTNSACYSPITYDEASWLTANFSYDKDNDKMKLMNIGEAQKWNQENFKQMFNWANNLFVDSFY